MSKNKKHLIKETNTVSDWDSIAQHPTILALSGMIDHHFTDVVELSGITPAAGEFVVLNNNNTIQKADRKNDSGGSVVSSGWYAGYKSLLFPISGYDDKWVAIIKGGGTTVATQYLYYGFVEENGYSWNFTTDTLLPAPWGTSYAVGKPCGGYDPVQDIYWMICRSSWPDNSVQYSYSVTFTVEMTGGIDTAVITFSNPLTGAHEYREGDRRPFHYNETQNCFVGGQDTFVRTYTIVATGGLSAAYVMLNGETTEFNSPPLWETQTAYDSTNDQYLTWSYDGIHTVALSGDKQVYISGLAAAPFNFFMATYAFYEQDIEIIDKYNAYALLVHNADDGNKPYVILGNINGAGDVDVVHYFAIPYLDLGCDGNIVFDPVDETLFIVQRQTGGVSAHPTYTITVWVNWSDMTDVMITPISSATLTNKSESFEVEYIDRVDRFRIIDSVSFEYMNHGRSTVTSNNFYGIYQGMNLSQTEASPLMYIQSNTYGGDTSFVNSGTASITLRGDDGAVHSNEKVDSGFGTSSIYIPTVSSTCHVQSTSSLQSAMDLWGYGGDFTFEYKFYPKIATANNRGLVGMWFELVTFTSTTGFKFMAHMVSGQKSVETGVPLPEGQWHHLVVERYGRVLTGFVNGIVAGTYTLAISDVLQTTNDPVLYIGGNAGYGYYANTGWYDEIKYFKTAVYQGENFVPPTSPNNRVYERRVARHGYIDSNQSGLTINTNYYMDEYGNITSNSLNGVRPLVGKAISDTEIIIKG